MDQCLDEDAGPWIFGTVTFRNGVEGLVDGEELYASTEAEAMADHAAVLARHRAKPS